MLKCKRCGKKLTGKQTSYCSQRCSKLHLKSLWRKRNREKVNEYNREYKKDNPGGFKYKYIDKEKKCFFCGSKNNLQKHHLNYEEQNVVLLCFNCHSKYHHLIKNSYFYDKIKDLIK
jgi:endogenous inhibitor of DNA gyrase (YacG/DUF329 family)